MSIVTVEVRFAQMTGDRHYSEGTHFSCKFSILLFGEDIDIVFFFKDIESSFVVFFRCFACAV